MISGGTVPTDSTELKVNTSSAGTYTCSVTINGEDTSLIAGNSTSGQGTAEIAAQSKYMCPSALCSLCESVFILRTVVMYKVVISPCLDW